MKRILAFGDSNTWGYDPATGQRYDETIRWTGLLQKALRGQALILEEGLCGRTTVFEDTDRVGRNGLAALPSVLRRSEPLDAAIIMLGTNDCKQVFGASSQEIAAGMALCLAEISEYVKAENILLISPICLEEVALGTSYNDRSLAVSRELSQAYQQPAKLYGVGFLAASEVAKASRIDGEHLTESGHRALYEAVYPFIKMRILTEK